ncbi:FMN-binding protein [Marinicella litoralis]|uniref:FMN-binding protein n=2 Tax=Marinicella litoralis TaxID=644220 RepID=A0A4R6XYC8_9GAMM|nr:FMN-binding protein [Marinicella litoralis]
MLASTGWSYTADEKLKIESFLAQQFKQQTPKPARLWVNAEIKAGISKILSRPSNQLNYRYWQAQGKTIWLLDELGKERDITTAVVVKNNQIAAIKVIVYRESRGGEVQVPWFTDQFVGVQSGTNWQRNIDSISGATLSVNAMKKQAELALFLNEQLP